jgi:hypothetical protein
LIEPETVSESFGATEVAITGWNDMQTKIATIINAERFMEAPLKSTIYILGCPKKLYNWRH